MRTISIVSTIRPSRTDNLRPVNVVVAGWYPDPTMRFELRYHNGNGWTADVSTNGERFVDPNGTSPSPNPSPAPHQPHQQHAQPSGDRNGTAVAAMVMGIIAIVIGWMPVIVVLGLIAAILAIVLGVAGTKRAKRTGSGKGFALAGMITGAVGLLVCIGGVIFTISLFRAIDRFDSPAENVADITSCTRVGNDVTAVGHLTNLSDQNAEFSVRVYFVRPGTDNPRRQILVDLGQLAPGEQTSFEVTRSVQLDEVDCIVGAVRGPLPYGIDPGT